MVALLSVTVTVNVEVPAVVGVPEIVPLPEPSESPAGNDPLVTDQENGFWPPDVAIVWLYASDTSLLGNDVVVIETGFAGAGVGAAALAGVDGTSAATSATATNRNFGTTNECPLVTGRSVMNLGSAMPFIRSTNCSRGLPHPPLSCVLSVNPGNKKLRPPFGGLLDSYANRNSGPPKGAVAGAKSR